MPDELNGEPGKYSIAGADAAGHVAFSAEAWQFFAFVFAALLTLMLTLIDENTDWPWFVRAGLKIGAFLSLGYLLLFNRPVCRPSWSFCITSVFVVWAWR
jgi:hypothetical protein